MGDRERVPFPRVQRLPSEPTDPLSVLKRVRERISTPDHWAKNVLARDEDFHRVGVNTSRAAGWSLVGAILLEGLSNQESRQIVSGLLKRLAGVVSLSYFNDRYTHAEVLELVDEGIGILSVSEVVSV